MLIATWNLNNRVGRVRFRPEAADAAIALRADILVFNEYYPKENGATFSRTLSDAGWAYQMISVDTAEIANLVLIASRIPLQPLDIPLPNFDRQFPSNVLCASVPSVGIAIVGIRVPWYDGKEVDLVTTSWDWVESTAVKLSGKPSLILGDLNVALKSNPRRGGDHFRRILQTGWHRAVPKDGASFHSEHGQLSEIDHILGTSSCEFTNARYITEIDGYRLAGSKDAISDHAALLADVAVRDIAPGSPKD